MGGETNTPLPPLDPLAQLGHGPARPAHASGLLRPPQHRTLTHNPHRHLSLPPHDPHPHSLVSLPHPRSRSGSRGTNPTSPRPLGEPRRPSPRPPRRRSFPRRTASSSSTACLLFVTVIPDVLLDPRCPEPAVSTATSPPLSP